MSLKQPQSQQSQGRGDRVLGLPRHNLSHHRHPPLTFGSAKGEPRGYGFNSIISSARASNDGGMVRFNSRAVFKLM